MIGMDFMQMYEENPKAAIALAVFMIAVVVIYYSGSAYSKYKARKRKLHEKLLEEQFKRKHNIR